ncbi:hypothetical protein HanRHA438_Chr12g0563941 [Helianthus annuus]|nr:hypothetical protein HanRHA438_Chr12g0563941 [Helianthus annuus]
MGQKYTNDNENTRYVTVDLWCRRSCINKTKGSVTTAPTRSPSTAHFSIRNVGKLDCACAC